MSARSCTAARAIAAACGIAGASAYAQVTPPDGMNAYVLKAVDKLYMESAGQGYDVHRAYSKPIPYGTGTVRPSAPPLTMCVAAVAEVSITALKLYTDETGDKTPYTYLTVDGWNRMRPRDIRSHIWVAHELDSYGTADAFVTFGIGRRVKFNELAPGSFVNLNRTNKSGHAVVFLSYVDKTGANLPTYSDDVKGFRYFSAQGRGTTPGAGFGYRVAFFTESNGSRTCPERTADGTKRDCDVMYTLSQTMLNTGYLQSPKYWNSKVRDTNIKAIEQGLYKQSRSTSGSFLGISRDLSKEKFIAALRQKDTLQLNPVFENANKTTDDD